jgi:hypothetical protein
MPREANAVDFWRGFALVSIFVNHIPGIYYERFTHRNLSFSDSAELFVFLAGWSLGLLVYGNGLHKGRATPLTFRLGGRSLQIYTAHIFISGLALSMLAGAAYLTDTPPILDWHNAAAFFQDPARTQLGIALLTHQLGYFDILPLYVVLMLIAPAFVIIDRFAPALLLPLSLGLYLTALIVHFTAPTWPVEGEWFFNPFTWQAIFVLGFVLSHLALAAVFSAVYPVIARAVPWITGPLSMLGRNSLQVFCVGSLLSLSGQIIRFLYSGSLAVDTIVVIVGIGLLCLTAWLAEWRQRLGSHG